jgi:EmrB/QacA subfamily drug resistance transporter
MSSALPAACDSAIAASVPARPGAPAHARMVLATCILASSLAFVDGSVVNVALPAIGRDLGAGGEGLSAIVNSFLLPLSALLLIGGAAGDRYGRRRVLVLGVLLFALASLLCALAASLGWLVLARALQGVGAALLMPNSLAILGASFQGDARGRAIGAWAAAGAAAGAIGPLVGGWLVDAVGWRTIFLINLPIAGLALLLASRCLRDEAASVHPPLDLGGAALATAGLAGLTWGLTAGAPWALACGVALLCAFVLLERRRGGRAMLPPPLFAGRGFASLNLLTLLLYGALGALFVMVPFVLIEATGYSAIAAGAALLPLPLVIAAGSPLMGRLGGRVPPRWPLAFGPLAVALGFLLMLRIDSGAGYWSAILPAVCAVALGMALAVAPLTTTVLSSVDAAHTGLASGFNSAVARLGGLIGTALLGTLLSGGPALVRHFHVAALACAAAALVAGAFGVMGTGSAVWKKK